MDPNKFLQMIFRHGFDKKKWVGVDPKMDPYTGLFEEGDEFYNFLGSFTTPPCTPNVEWILFKNPIPTARGNLDNLKKFLKTAKQSDEYGHDFRPVQPLHGRHIYSGKSGRLS